MARRYINAQPIGAEVMLGTAGTGTEQIGIPFDCADGARRTWYGYFSEAAQARTVESMVHCGWGGDWNDFSTMTNEVQLVVDDEEYPVGSGTWREKVQFVNRAGGVAMKSQMDEQQKKTFAARMRGTVSAVFAEAGARPAQPAAAGARKPPTHKETHVPYRAPAAAAPKNAPAAAEPAAVHGTDEPPF